MSLKSNLASVVDRLYEIDESELTQAETTAIAKAIERLEEELQEIEDRFAEVEEVEDDEDEAAEKGEG